MSSGTVGEAPRPGIDMRALAPSITGLDLESAIRVKRYSLQRATAQRYRDRTNHLDEACLPSINIRKPR